MILSNKQLAALATVQRHLLMTAIEVTICHDVLIPAGFIDASGTWFVTAKGLAALAAWPAHQRALFAV